MKIIDQTPFYKEDGTLSLVERARAVMKFGNGWIREVEAQKPVIAILERVLDRKFTLLRNITPPGLDTMIPLLLIGPTGVYVMWVNPLPGVFSARGDQWGVISGGSLQPQKPNLLTRTDRMARAVQLYLKREGLSEMFTVEAILLCSDPTTNVDSVRPIIRVVQRDAIERFGVSIAQARVIIGPETVFNIVNLMQKAPAPAMPGPAEAAAAVEGLGDSQPSAVTPATETPQAPDTTPPASGEQIPDFLLPTSGSQVTDTTTSAMGSLLPDSYIPPSASRIPETYIPPSDSRLPDSAPAAVEPSSYQVEPPPPAWAPTTAGAVSATQDSQSVPAVRRSSGMTRKQWIFLLIMALVWVVIVAVFVFLIAKDFLPGFLPVK